MVTESAFAQATDSHARQALLEKRQREFDILLEDFRPSEQRAILIYQLELQHDLHREVSIEEAVHCWEFGPAKRWRRTKMRLDGQMQLREIEKHKYIVSQELGRDVGWEAAASDWIQKYAAVWREWWEQQPDASPGLDGSRLP